MVSDWVRNKGKLHLWLTLTMVASGYGRPSDSQFQTSASSDW